MTNALPTTTDTSLLKYFELQRPPFEPLTDPSELYLTEQHSFLSAHLADAMEEQDMLVVVCGQPGSGKSSLLARYSNTVYDSICLASIDNSCCDITQFYSTVLGQFGFGEISGTVEQLRHICMEFLKQQGKAGDPVVILVDNAHQLRPEIFEQLRWAAGIRHNARPIVNLVLAGHPDLAKIMESPAMSQINAKHHVRFNIRAYTEDETANYIWHRLELAGDRQCVQFSDEAHSLIFRYSGGTPGLINLVCSEALQEIFRQEKKTISGEVIRRVAEKHNMIPHVVPVQNKSRRKTDSGYVDEALSTKPESKPATAPEPEVTPTVKKTDKPTPSGKSASEVSKNNNKTKTAETPTLKASNKRSAASALSIVEKVASLSEQLGDLRARKKDLELELFQRDSTIASLEDRLATEAHLHSKVKNQLEKGDNESEALRKKLSKARNKLKAQGTQLDGLVSTTDELQSQLEAALHERAELTQALTSSAARLEVLQERAELSAALQSALNDREQRLKEHQSAIRESETELRTHRAQVDEQAALIAALQKEVDQSNKSADEIVALQKTIQDQEAQIESLRELVESEDESGADKTVAALRLEIRDLEEELDATRLKYHELESTQESNAGLSDQMKAEIADLTEQLAASEKQEESAREQSLAAQEVLQDKLAKTEQIVSDLQDQLQARHEHSDWLKTELLRLQDTDERLAKAEIDNQASRKQLLRADHDLQSANEEISQLQMDLEKAVVSKQQLAETRLEIEATRQDLADAEAQIGRLQEEKTQLMNRIAQSGDSMAQLEGKASDLQQQNEHLESMLGDVTTRLAESERQISEIEANKEKLEAEKDALHSELESLREEVSQTKPYKENFERQKEVNAELSETLDARTHEIAELTTRLADQAIAHSKATAALASMKKLQPEVEELNEQVVAIESQLLNGNENIKVVDEHLATNDQQCSEIESELASIRAQQAELLGGLEKASGSKSEVEAARREIEMLKAELEAAEKDRAGNTGNDNEVAVLKEQLAEKQAKEDRLAAELDESRAQLNDIQKEFAREAQDNHELQRQLLALADVDEQLREELVHRSELFEDLSEIENERNQLREELERLRRIQASSREKKVPVEESKKATLKNLAFELELRHGESSVETSVLAGEGDKLLVGRGEQSDIVVDSDFISRNHLLISVFSGRLFVKDLHSTNGTFVNGKRISHCEMHDGDIIAMGEHTISLTTSPRQ